MDDWLLKNPTAPVIMRDVYNLVASVKKQRDGGFPPIQALFANLQKSDRYLYDHCIDHCNRLWNLVFFDKTSLNLLHRFPSTIALDSTYKTNRHNLYLLNIVGTTATNSSFIVGQAFLSAETTEDYNWVLEWLENYYTEAGLPPPLSITTDKAGGLMKAVEIIYPEVPHLLCIWHVNNDVEAYCRKLWKTEIESIKDHTTAEERATFVDSRWTNLKVMWQATIYATTETEFEDAWEALTLKYWEEYPEIISYLADNWICHKEKICIAWTNKITHFGNATTSRVESIHSAVKKDLPSKLLHLHDVWQLLSLYLTRTARELSHKIGYQRSKVKDSHRKAIFTPLHHYISHYAIDKVLEGCGHFNLFADPGVELPACTKAFTTTMGLPCAHIVQDRMRANGALQIADFHPQWYLDDPAERPPIDPILLLRDPVKVRAYGKDDGKKGRRELLQVEHTRRATAVPIRKESRAQSTWDYTKVARDYAWNRPVEDLVQHLPKLATGPSFHRVTRDHELYHVTENRGQEDLHPEPQWIEECWHREINLGRETYKILLEIGQVRNRQIAELVYRREERADMQAMQERARQVVRERQRLEEAREEAVLQGLRRSERGRQPRKRKPGEI
jgi:hypothetical protein